MNPSPWILVYEIKLAHLLCGSPAHEVGLINVITGSGENTRDCHFYLPEKVLRCDPVGVVAQKSLPPLRRGLLRPAMYLVTEV